jgi:2,3-bisphosphoglycerate-dependent phosphoglycerate mutase
VRQLLPVETVSLESAAMPVHIVCETHSTTTDNESGIATGGLPGQLSVTGEQLAAELGRRRTGDGISSVFCSDLARATQTAAIAFAGSGIPVLADWRLRECDYGELNGAPAALVQGQRAKRLDLPYPGGESWRQAVARISWFLGDLPRRWAGQRVLVIGHVATRWGLDHSLRGIPLEELAAADVPWQPGWEYLLN